VFMMYDISAELPETMINI